MPTEGLFRAETTLLLTVVIVLKEYLNILQRILMKKYIDY